MPCSDQTHNRGESDAAFRQLFIRNKQWTHATNATERDFFPFHPAPEKQTPGILWIGCSDSRVPESVITGSTIGTIFTHRNIANQFLEGDNNVGAVLEYAVDNLGVQHVVIAGHFNCGGVAASYNLAYPNNLARGIEPGFAPDQRDASSRPPGPQVLAWLQPLAAFASQLNFKPSALEEPTPPVDNVNFLAHANVRRQVESVAHSLVIRKAWEEGRNVSVHGVFYDYRTGDLTNLEVTQRLPCLL